MALSAPLDSPAVGKHSEREAMENQMSETSDVAVVKAGDVISTSMSKWDRREEDERKARAAQLKAQAEKWESEKKSEAASRAHNADVLVMHKSEVADAQASRKVSRDASGRQTIALERNATANEKQVAAWERIATALEKLAERP